MSIPAEYINQIVTGDARVLSERIPDASVDLIFTDPVYENIDDYRWLAETAARVLKPDRACLVWYAHNHFDAAYRAMVPPLSYAWLMHWQRHGHMAIGRSGISVITPCLWLEKGRSKTRRMIADWCATTNGGASARTHAWGKPEALINKWVDAFARPGSVVFDPFAGSGTLPVVCKKTGRDYIAFEIDPDTAARARARVEATQAMHPVFLEEQTMMQVAV